MFGRNRAPLPTLLLSSKMKFILSLLKGRRTAVVNYTAMPFPGRLEYAMPPSHAIVSPTT